MPTITLKADETFCKALNEMAGELKVSKSELVRRAVDAYSNNLEREHLKVAMQQASYRVRQLDSNVVNDFDALAGDGLDNV